MTTEILPVTIFKIVDSKRSGPKGRVVSGLNIHIRLNPAFIYFQGCLFREISVAVTFFGKKECEGDDYSMTYCSICGKDIIR